MKNKILTTLIALAATLAASAQDLSLWYSQPAKNWLEALPIGNGSLGGMIFGATTNERVQFNEQTLWLGSETEMGSYQPFGDVFVEWQHTAPTDYRRELKLADAIHRVSYRDGGVKFQREAFSSFPDQVMVWHDPAGRCASGPHCGSGKQNHIRGHVDERAGLRGAVVGAERGWSGGGE
jgi:alpha-L-fucosidase 2